MNKYELTEETKIVEGVKLYRIRALCDIPLHYVKTGQLGGWIASEYNLSQTGDCWVGDDARVCDMARIQESALLRNNACAKELAWLGGRSVLSWGATAKGCCQIYGSSNIYEHAVITDKCKVINSTVYGRASIGGGANVRESTICGRASIRGDADVLGSTIGGDARVLKNGLVGYSLIGGNVVIKSEYDLITVGICGEKITYVYKTDHYFCGDSTLPQSFTEVVDYIEGLFPKIYVEPLLQHMRTPVC